MHDPLKEIGAFAGADEVAFEVRILPDLCVLLDGDLDELTLCKVLRDVVPDPIEE